MTQSIIKLLSRIVKPSEAYKSKEMSLNDHSYGITNDPLSHFALAFCGIIHDGMFYFVLRLVFVRGRLETQ